MKKIIFFIALIALSMSCKKLAEKRAATVTIKFQTTVNANHFNLTNTFTDSENREIRLELVKFYLANLKFIDTDGLAIETDDILLVELDENGTAAFETKVEAGNYTAIEFGIGVPQAMNEANPNSFTEPEHPLNVLNNTYWGMNSMYRFVMIDGRYFEAGDYKGVFSYHTGHNDSYRTVSLKQDMSFKKKTAYTHTIFIDVTKILEGSGGNLDIEDTPNYHGNLDDFYLSKQLSDNFVQALSLN